jgi:hypothetical protein
MYRPCSGRTTKFTVVDQHERIVRAEIDLEEYAREIGALRKFETLAD